MACGGVAGVLWQRSSRRGESLPGFEVLLLQETMTRYYGAPAEEGNKSECFDKSRIQAQVAHLCMYPIDALDWLQAHIWSAWVTRRQECSWGIW